MCSVSGCSGQAEFLFERLRKPVPVRIVQMDIEWLQSLQNGQSDAPGGHRPDGHPFQVVGPRDAVGDVPAFLDHPLV
jgi:hypothetical protein